MAVIFTSTIKMDEAGEKWFIELKDMVDDRVVKCYGMAEYVSMVEEFGNDYGGNIDSVNWYKDEGIPEQIMDEIRFEMAQQQAEIEEKTGEPLIKEKED